MRDLPSTIMLSMRSHKFMLLWRFSILLLSCHKSQFNILINNKANSSIRFDGAAITQDLKIENILEFYTIALINRIVEE